VTDFRMPVPTVDVVSVAAIERGQLICDISTPIVGAADLITCLGTYPTLTFPIRRGRPVDVVAMYEFVAEPAEFFGLAVPSMGQFHHAVTGFIAAVFERSSAALVTATLTVADERVVVTGAPGVAFVDVPVRIGRLDPHHRPPRAGDAHWLRMAARTVSRAGSDHLLRALRDAGCVDGIPAGADIAAPLAGALVLGTGAGLVGIDTDQPISILHQLRDCGVLADLPRRLVVAQPEVQRAWWISPQFSAQPIEMLGERALPVDPKPPSFLEQL
jgi:hypothetical protein